MTEQRQITPDSPAALINRELSWLGLYEEDNCSAWDMQPDGEYLLRHPAAGESRRIAQELFIERSASSL
jgi:polyphosphate kinase